MSEDAPPLPPRPALAVIIDGPEGWLTVRRPSSDEDLPLVWGLPATTRHRGESPADAVMRIGREKLGVDLEDGGCRARGEIDRPTGRLAMRVHRARIVSGAPAVPQPVAGVTQYSECRWAPPDSLAPGAARGSLCCRLALESRESRSADNA